MRLKKLLAAAAAAAMASVLFVMPVSACGGRHRQARAVDVDTSYSVCTVEGCAETGRIPMTARNTAAMAICWGCLK